jgi:hypothetical protein
MHHHSSPQVRLEVFSLFDLIIAGTWAGISVFAFTAWLGWIFHLFPFIFPSRGNAAMHLYSAPVRSLFLSLSFFSLPVGKGKAA